SWTRSNPVGRNAKSGKSGDHMSSHLRHTTLVSQMPAHFVGGRPKPGFKVEGGAVGQFLIVSLGHDDMAAS
ncbi:MAG: hypothetical protein ACLQSR_12700, partial [Limisphaerales bacterium]